jgi:hypothetical protein
VVISNGPRRLICQPGQYLAHQSGAFRCGVVTERLPVLVWPALAIPDRRLPKCDCFGVQIPRHCVVDLSQRVVLNRRENLG